MDVHSEKDLNSKNMADLCLKRRFVGFCSPAITVSADHDRIIQFRVGLKGLIAPCNPPSDILFTF
jgi:hypothetical protein